MKFTHLFQRHDLKKGIVLVLFAWLCFSTLYMVSKLISDQTTVPTMLFFRNVLGILITIPLIFKDWPKSLELKNYKIVVSRSLFGLLNLCFIFLAVSRISLVNTTLLNNSAPFFVPFILWFWRRVPINHKMWPAIIAGFVGIVFILHPDKRIFNLGAAYALISGIILATNLVMMRLASKTENLVSFLLYFFLIGAIVTTPFAIAYWQIDNFLTLLGLLAIGLLSFLGQIGLYYGMRLGKANQLAPFTYSMVVFSGIYEWLIWGQVPHLIAYIGMALIIAAGIWVIIVSPPQKKIE